MAKDKIEKYLKIDGRKFSIAGLMGIIEEMEPGDEVRFSFSDNLPAYHFLRKHIEDTALETFGKYEVNRTINVSNKSKENEYKLDKKYTIVVKRLN